MGVNQPSQRIKNLSAGGDNVLLSDSLPEVLASRRPNVIHRYLEITHGFLWVGIFSETFTIIYISAPLNKMNLESQ